MFNTYTGNYQLNKCIPLGVAGICCRLLRDYCVVFSINRRHFELRNLSYKTELFEGCIAERTVHQLLLEQALDAPQYNRSYNGKYSLLRPNR